MHPYTVYGIETKKIREEVLKPKKIACTLIPFTVLKLTDHISYEVKPNLIACTLIPFTVLKLRLQKPPHAMHIIACTLIPFTVLKLFSSINELNIGTGNCMHPYTVYGIETNIKLHGKLSKLRLLHAPLYRLRY